MNTLFQAVTTAHDEDKVVEMSSSAAIKKASKILIKDLELMMFIGVFDAEKSEKQRVIVNLEIDVMPNEQWQSDDIKDIVSYVDVIERIQLIAESGHIHLVETFAEQIAETCFSFTAITGAVIRVEKPDIISNTGSVGTELTISR